LFAAAHELYHLKRYLYGLRLIRESKEKAISKEKADEIMSDKKTDIYEIKKQLEWRKLHHAMSAECCTEKHTQYG
jgi:hypothetical protein